ncbi:MAG: hypothetical protein K2W95_14890 [Candidatus Obscuribacterales bacterium]|nr:hypothetical protein [Candidatus Obscuribacterales bacterium]
MNLTKSTYLLVIDYLMMASLTLAAFCMPELSGGPFAGGFAYMVLRYAYAFATGNHIHANNAYRILDVLFIASLVVAGFTIPAWGGGPFAAAFAAVVLRFIYEACME